MVLVTLVLGISAVDPYDRGTWLLEVAPVVIAIAVLAMTYPRFALTPLVYRLLFLHALVLIVGGYYTYARVPPGFWVQDWLDLERNHYDRFAHVMQGFVPAMLIRELLLRTTILKRGGLTFLTVTSMCLAFSALYELLEWWTAVFAGDGAVEFLGTQGDPWDAQWDMFLALIGALAAQLLLAKTQDRTLNSLHI
jgi:putative membrane protein